MANEIVIKVSYSGNKDAFLAPEGSTAKEVVDSEEFKDEFGDVASGKTILVNGSEGSSTVLKNGDEISFRAGAAEKG